MSNADQPLMELPKTYDPSQVDAKWYQSWEDKGFFAPQNHSHPAFSVSMPPPNVTGVLHMGHALDNTLADIIVRYKRMQGFNTLWVPGTDHAGIATQTVVERHLIQTQNKRRKDFSREEFLKHVWAWKNKSESVIVEQIKKIACSCDWSRQRFTMDALSNKAVCQTFKQLYDEGLIYRGDYLVNWDPITQTALADDEVEYEDKQSFLWHFQYPLKDSQEHVCIATTRPETMLGDTALAVNPKDERYQHLIGKTVILPLMNREIPIIADPFVDPEFGSGVVKITPAHDPNDYQMGLNHQLAFINIMTPDGKVNENGGVFAGLSFELAREKVVNEMTKLGLLVKKEAHLNRVGISYRSKAVIEPYLSKQWFVKMESFKPILRQAIETKQVQLIPSSWEQTYFHWIDNLRDWCISRQLWWGHRIPVWYSKQNPEYMICYDGEGLPEEVAKNPDDFYQDEDVLDTWFSSALWPFNILNWQENSPESQVFYPNSVLITGHDILFFWVARMLLMGKHLTGTFPFPKVFLHGLIFGKSYWRKAEDGSISYVSDEERKKYDLDPSSVPKDVHFKWEKLSKSKGNVIDPLEIIQQYGTDAMRMALCASNPQLSQIDLDRRKFEEFKNFTNKIWNGARFVFMNLEADEAKGLSALSSQDLEKGLDKTLLKIEDKWILKTLKNRSEKVASLLDAYAFDQAAQQAYDFFWKEFCAYYVEMAKPYLFGKLGSQSDRAQKQKILVIVLCAAVRMLHPMAPFITEELFKRLQSLYPQVRQNQKQDPFTKDLAQALSCESSMLSAFPSKIEAYAFDENVEHEFELIQQTLYAIRNIRGEMNIAPSLATDIYIISQANSSNFLCLQNSQALISHSVKTQTLSFLEQEPKLPFASTALLEGFKIMIPLPQELREKEQVRLNKEKEKTHINIEKLSSKLQNQDFIQRAPEDLVVKQKALLQAEQEKLQEIISKLQQLESL